MIERWSVDKQLRARVSDQALHRMEKSCRLAYPLETGGILVGRYSPELDCAYIEGASGAPLDSSREADAFRRGTRHLQKWLTLLWKHRAHYYLGEWHYHPSSDAAPSRADIGEMTKIATAPEYLCPEPLLVILSRARVVSDNIFVGIILADTRTIELRKC